MISNLNLVIATLDQQIKNVETKIKPGQETNSFQVDDLLFAFCFDMTAKVDAGKRPLQN